MSEYELNEEKQDNADKSPIESESSLESSSEGREFVEVGLASSPQLDSFLDELDKIPDDELKLRKILSAMEGALSLEVPDFKFFWEVRKLTFIYLKKQLNPTFRLQVWDQLSELAKEARRLKNLFDEQSDYAAEQIDMAIQALENQIIEKPQHIIQLPDIDLKGTSRAIKENYALYNSVQKELTLLNIQASRINALRKELIKTGMRIKTKNKFFHRLSKVGDSVFPLRKELIKDLSTNFQKDVEQFINDNFSHLQEPSYILREEIKLLQNMAKLFTLNSQVFSHTRMKLSECWDQLKESEKERKKEFSQKKEIFKQNCEELKKNLSEIEANFENQSASINEVLKQLDGVVATMRAKELGREEVQELKGLIIKLREKVHTKQNEKEQEHLHQETLKIQQKKERYQGFSSLVDELLNLSSSFSIEQILEKKENLLLEIRTSPLSKQEKGDLEKKLGALKEIIQSKKEQLLLNLPADKRQALDQLYELLEQKKEKKEESKRKLKEVKKQGSSGFDFERALNYDLQLKEAHAKVEEVTQAVIDLESKISALEEELT